MANMMIIRENEVSQIPITKIKLNPFQPRVFFDREAVNDLATSIRQFGVLQPICVRCVNKIKDYYEVVFGERRLKACKLIGMFYIPCIVVNITDKDCATISLIENMQEEKLNFFEEAQGIYNIMHDYNYSFEEVSKLLGKKESYVKDKVELLKLNYELRREIIENNISEEHSFLLSQILDGSVISMIIKNIVKHGLSVPKTKVVIQKIFEKAYMGFQIDDYFVDEISKNIEKYMSNNKITTRIKNAKFFTNDIYEVVQTMKQFGMKTDCKFTENDNQVEVIIKVDKTY